VPIRTPTHRQTNCQQCRAAAAALNTVVDYLAVVRSQEQVAQGAALITLQQEDRSVVQQIDLLALALTDCEQACAVATPVQTAPAPPAPPGNKPARQDGSLRNVLPPVLAPNPIPMPMSFPSFNPPAEASLPTTTPNNPVATLILPYAPTLPSNHGAHPTHTVQSDRPQTTQTERPITGQTSTTPTEQPVVTQPGQTVRPVTAPSGQTMTTEQAPRLAPTNQD
jgi:hypothetical protein